MKGRPMGGIDEWPAVLLVIGPGTVAMIGTVWVVWLRRSRTKNEQSRRGD